MSYEVIAKDAQGGIVYSFMSNGKKKYGYKSDEYSTTDRQTVKNILMDIKAGQEGKGVGTPAVVQKRGQESILEQAPTTARAQKLVEGVPFAGSWIDEAAQVISPELGAKTRALSEAKQTIDPIESEALKFAGATASTLPLGLLGGLGALEKGTRAQKIGKGIGIGGLLGGVEGAVYGAGEAAPGERLEGAKTGATFGTMAGATFGGAAPLIGEGAENLVNYIKRSDLNVISSSMGISAAAAKVIKHVVGSGGNIDDAVANIQRAGEQGMIADANEAMQVLLDASASASPKASQVVSEAVDTRAKQASGRIDEVMTDVLGEAPTGRITAAEEVAKRNSKERREAYTAAYATPIDYSSETGMAIEGLMARIPDDLKTKAIKEANDRMKFEGLTNQQIMATIADDGTVTFSEMPNMQQLDYIKRALGGMAEDAKGEFGKATSSSIFYGQIAQELRDLLVKDNKAYKQALQLGGDKIREEQAGELGYKLLRPSTTREEVARTLANSTNAEKETARLGVRNYIDDTLANVKATISSPDVDVKSAAKLLSELSSRANQEKMGFILGPEEARKLSTEIEQVRAALELKAAVALNSKTAQRQATIALAGDLTEKGALQTLLAGHPGEATQKVVQALTGATKEMEAAQQAELFEELATVLTEKRGPEAQAALRMVMQAMDGQQLTDTQAKLIANVVIMGTAAPAATTAGRALSE